MAGRKESGLPAEFCPNVEYLPLPNGARVLLIGVNHNIFGVFEAHKPVLQQLINESSFLATEGSPAEIHLSENVSGGIFGKVAALAPESMPIICADPAGADNNDVLNVLAGTEVYLLPLVSAFFAGVLTYSAVKDVLKAKDERGPTRRELLVDGAKKVGIVSTIAAINSVTQAADLLLNLGNSDKCEPNITPNIANQGPETMMRFRNSGMYTILAKAAEQGIIKGDGILVVGNEHAREIGAFYKTPQEAENAFQGTWAYKLLHVLGGQQIAVWKRYGNSFHKETSFSVIPG